MRSFCSFLFVLILITGLAAGGWFASYVLTPSQAVEEQIVHIPQGVGVRKIQGLLAQKGIIVDDIRFLALARLFHVIEHPPRLRAGEFKVPPGLNPLEVIRFLDTAQPVRHRVTIPEGKNMKEIAAIFAEDNWVDPSIFLRLCRDLPC